MAKISYQYLRQHTNKAGVTSYFWEPSKLLAQAGWIAQPLGKDRPTALAALEARNAEVKLWKAGGSLRLDVKKRAQQGTLASLIAHYRRDVLQGKNTMTGELRIRARTAEGYETALKRLEAWAGQQPLAYITPARVGVLRDANARPVAQGGLGHSATLNLLKTLRQVFAFAESIDLVPKGSNPATNFGLGAVAPRHEVWELDDEAAFTAAAYALGMPSMALAIELAIYTAQREGDLIKFTEAQLVQLIIHDPLVAARVSDGDGVVMGWILDQGKTGTPMQIALETDVLAKVHAAIRVNRAKDRAADPQRLLTHVLVDDSTGKPWVKRAFIKAYRRIIEHAAKATARPHMHGLVWHDLRRTRVVRMRRRGIAPATIAALTGHKLRSIEMMLSVYGPIDATSTAAALVSVMAPAKTIPSKTEKPPENGTFR